MCENPSEARTRSGRDLDDGIKLRLEAIKDAQARTRFVFATTTFVCVSVLTATYNACGSWIRGFANRPDWDGGKVTQAVQERLVSEWVASTSISIPLLGIRMSVSDAATLGALVIFILTFWLFFSMRRENRTIGTLLIDTVPFDLSVRRVVYHAIVGHSVFTTVHDTNQPISSLNQDMGELERVARRTNQGRFRWLVRGIFRWRFLFQLLLFLPFLTIVIVIVSDQLTLYVLPAVFRGSAEPLYDLLERRGELPRAHWFDWIGFVLSAITAYGCVKIQKFERATRNVLTEYRGGVYVYS